MKRCPQCEFIYEDEQSLCDMDGVLLVFDSRALPNHEALATVPVKTQQRRNRAVPAFATLILALVLGLVYYVSTQRNAVQNTDMPADAASTSTPAPAPEMSPSPEEVQPQEMQPPAVELKPATTKPVAVAAPKKPVAKVVPSPQPQTKPRTEPKKEESKVGSILKKTGRILKKPFKF